MKSYNLKQLKKTNQTLQGGCLQIEKDGKSGRPRDAQSLQLLTKPKYKNKIMSNDPTSNLQRPTSNSAITLIALIITIIVLLILSGVTLSMVMGESGIFGKANWAKFVTEFRNVEEAEHLYELNNQLDESKEQTKNNYAITQTTIEATGTLKDTIIENEGDENPQLYIIDLSKFVTLYCLFASPTHLSAGMD